MNTPEKGQFRYIVFKEGDVWYAVALEFNIVESADDDKIALFNLFQAANGYIQASGKVRGSRHQPLNQIADSEYEKLWNDIHSNAPIKSPYQIGTYGIHLVNA